MNRLLTIALVLMMGVSVSGQDVAWILLEAQSYVDNNQTDKALVVLSDALETSNDVRLLLKRADMYLINNNLLLAIADYNRANALKFGIGEYGLARCYALKNDASTAVYHLELEMQSVYKRLEKEVLLDNYLAGISATNEWKQFVKKEWYTQVESQVAEVEYYLSSGKTGEALTIINELKNNYPNDVNVQYIISLFDYSVGDNDKAIAALLPVFSSKPENVDYGFLLARAYYASGNYPGAITVYNKMIDTGIADASLYLSLADCYKKVGEFTKARENIDKYLTLYPEEEKALRLAGEIRSATGDYKEALVVYSKMIDENVGDPKNFTDRADTYFMAKSWELAAVDYGMALDLEPGNIDNWVNKGMAHIYLKQTEIGCYCFKMAEQAGGEKALQLIEKYCR